MKRWLLGALVCLSASAIVSPAFGAPSERTFRRAEQSVRKLLRDKGVSARFYMTRRSPFLVIGDGGRADVERRASRTVAMSTERLKRLFGWSDPDRVLTVWLFKSRSSYRRHSKLLFDDEPSTPFGYYSPGDSALIMNISTGGGTLIHELVHPYVEHNFPGCPAWFNEGLGSLFEATTYRGPKIVGLTNWRLPNLQALARYERLPTFRALMSTTSDEFYEDEVADNYAQARYLLYYLQERGLLARYYREFRRYRRWDPTGYKTLKRVLGPEGKNMARFQKRWQRWVLGLRWR